MLSFEGKYDAISESWRNEMDREKVISWVEGLAEDDWRLFHSDSEVQNIAKAVLALLKEQEEREQRICKSICNFIRGACSTDTDDDKDFVCYEIQKCFTEGR